MATYRLTCDTNRFHSLTFVRPPRVGWANRYAGQPVAAGWKPLSLRGEWSKELGDFLGFYPHLPVLHQRAIDHVAPLLHGRAEVLPVKVVGDLRRPGRRSGPARAARSSRAAAPPDQGPYFALNVTNVLDLLDLEASDIHRFEQTILHVRKHVFRTDEVEGHPIFRLQGYEISAVYVSEEFRARVEAGGLTGLVWEPID